jgi:hypothetical protein
VGEHDEEKVLKNQGRYSPRAALVAVGLKVGSLKLLEPVKQKAVIHRFERAADEKSHRRDITPAQRGNQHNYAERPNCSMWI